MSRTVGGPMGWSTFILLANPSPSPLATDTFLRTDRPPHFAIVRAAWWSMS